MLRKSALFLFLLIARFQGVHAQADLVRIDFADSLPKTQSDTAGIRLQLLYGQDHLLQRDPDSVLLLARALLRESRHLNYPFGIISSYYLLGRAYQALGIYDKSFSNYQAALPYFTGAYKKKLAQHYNDIAVMLVYAGDYKEGANYLYKALAESQHNPASTLNTAPIYNNLFSIWRSLGDINKALAYLDKAEAAAIAAKDSFSLGNILNRQGGMRLGYNDSQARHYLEEAERISHACGDIRTEIQAQGNLAFLFALQGKEKAARQYLNKVAVTFNNSVTDIYSRIGHFENAGRVWQMLKHYKQAEGFLIEACTLADSIRSPWHKKGSLEELSNLYANTGRYQQALQIQQEYAQVQEALHNEERQKSLYWLDSKYQAAQLELEETRQKLRLAEQQSKMRQQQLLIFSGIGLLILLTVLYLMMRRNQKRRLRLQEQESRAFLQESELQKTKALIDGEERERKRVALELHDGIGSMLSIAKLNLSVVRDSYDRGRLDVPHRFSEVLGLLDRSSQAIRSTAHALMPEILLQGGLNEALGLYFTKLTGLKSCQLRFTYYGEPALLEAEKERNIFRALQQVTEALIDNVQPKALWVQLNWQDTCLYVTVEIESAEIEGESDTGVLIKTLQAMLTLADGIVYNDEESDTFDIEFSL